MKHFSYSTLTQKAGYALPILVVLSSAFLIIGVSILQVVTSLRVTLDDQYKTSLAREAADSGIAYATSCLQKSNYVAKWTDARPLTQSTDCSGYKKTDPGLSGFLAFLPEQALQTSNIKTTFSVGALTAQDAISQTIQAKGQVYTKSGGSFASLPSHVQDAQKRVKRTDYGNNTYTYRARGACSIRENTVECRGDNNTGQLGRGNISGGQEDKYTNGSILLPSGLQGKAITKVEGGANHVCMIGDGKLYCWGSNGDGQLGNGNTADNGTPAQVGGLLNGKTVTDVQAFNRTTCAIAKDVYPPSTYAALKNSPGKIYCWGDNRLGAIGNNNAPNDQSYPQSVTVGGFKGLPASYDAVSLAKGGGGALNTCAIVNNSTGSDDRQAYCWGDNGYGQLGTYDYHSWGNMYSETQHNAPYQVYQEGGILQGKKLLTIATEGLAITAVDVGGIPIPEVEVVAHTCAVTDAEFKVYCWGSNRFGELGRHDQGTGPIDGDQRNNPYANTGAPLIGQGCGFLTFCRSTHNRPLPVESPDSNSAYSKLRNKTVTDVSTGIYNTCAIADGKPYCWGANTCGALGININPGTGDNGGCPKLNFFYRSDLGDRDYAVPVADPYNRLKGKRSSALSSAGWTTCLVSDRDVACWGRNDFYEMGLTSPRQTGTASDNTLQLLAPEISTYIKPLFPDYSY